jgi:hypothetical protein
MAALMVRSSACRLPPTAYSEGAAHAAAETALARIIDCLDELASLLDTGSTFHTPAPIQMG